MMCMRPGCTKEALKGRKTCGKECFSVVRQDVARKASAKSPWKKQLGFFRGNLK